MSAARDRTGSNSEGLCRTGSYIKQQKADSPERAAALKALRAEFSIPAGLVGLTNGAFACLSTGLYPTRVCFTGVGFVFNIAFTGTTNHVLRRDSPQPSGGA